MGKTADYPIRSKPGEPPWELATLYSPQGSWTIEEYLNLETNRLIEFKAGLLEFLDMPTEEHQDVVAAFYELLKAFVIRADLGKVNFAPIRIRLGPDQVREPDVVFMLRQNDGRRHSRAWDGADLVAEVVSEAPADRERDYVEKRAAYEQAGIPEYWIIDPIERRVTVLALRDGRYIEHSVARDHGEAASALLAGFTAPLSGLFAAQRG